MKRLPPGFSWLNVVALKVSRSGTAGIGLDDLVQIGAVAAIEAIDSHNGSAALSTWQWREAEWTMREAVHKAVRRARIAPMDPLPERPEFDDDAASDFVDLEDNGPRPDESLERAKCAQALAALPGPQRNLLLMLHGHGLTRADVAREIGGDRWTVRAAEMRALEALRGMMES